MTAKNTGRPKKKIEDLATNDNNEPLLFCTSCGNEKTLKSFGVCARSGIGRQSKCKQCEKEYREENKSNLERYRKENKKAISEKTKEYSQKNADKINSWRRSYYAKEGRTKILAANAERRALKITTSDGTVTGDLVEELYLAQGNKCNICKEEFKEGKNSMHIDHIIPISKGGKHTEGNVHLTCPTCNLEKGAKSLSEYLLGRPSKYDPETQVPIMFDIMTNGGSIEEVCASIGIAKDTFYKWIDKHPDFSYAKRLAEQESYAWWLTKGRTQLENKEFSATLYYMNMKNRFNWSDKQEVVNHDPKNVDSKWKVEFVNATPEEK